MMSHTKRSLINGLIIILFAAGTGYAITPLAHAQSTATPTDTQTLLAQLLAQLAVLQQKIADLGGTSIETPPQLAANPVPAPPIFSEGRDSSGAGQACALTRTLSFGATGDEVVCLQQQLIARGLLAPDSATGFFGNQTRAAAVAFQRMNNLEQVGVIGPLTRALINADAPPTLNLEATPPRSVPPSADGSLTCALTRTLAPGTKGEDVSCLQQLLISKSLLSADSATGYFGHLTESAVKQFQRAHDLEQVGVIGPLTRTIINAKAPDEAPGEVAATATAKPTIALLGNYRPIGYLDNANPNRTVTGWSLDPGAPSVPISVHIYVDGPAGKGVFVGSTIANLSRPDVNRVTGYPGEHGFRFTIPQSVANGTHTVYAYGIDPAGGVKTLLIGSPKSVTLTSPPPTPTDTVPPTVSLTAPVASATVSGAVTVSATASDNVGIAGVQFKLDGVNLGEEDTTAPYSTNWNTSTAANGAHTLTAIARDAAGNTKTATAVTVTVSNTYGVPTATPVAGAYTAVQNITLTAPGAASIHYTLDGTAPSCTTGSTYTSPIAITTTKTIKAIACYAGGSSAVASFAYVINITTTDTIPPTVSLTAPANGATVSGTTNISATASDNIAVVGVQFKLDGANLGAEDATAPYSTSWNTTSSTNGAHTIAVVARDAAGNRATSTVSVTVANETGFSIPPILVGWEFGQGNVPANQLDQIAPTSNVVHIGGRTDANIIGKVQAASAKGLKSIIGVQLYFFATAQMKDGTAIRSSLRASGEADFDALWASLGSLQLQNDVIGFFVIDEPYAHLQDVGFDSVSAFQGPGPRQLRKDIDHVISYLHAKAPGRLTFIPFTHNEIQQSTFAASNAAARLLPPALDLIGIDCYEGCVTDPNTGNDTGIPAQLYQRIVSVKAPSQKIAPTFSPGAREPYMSAERDLNLAAQLAIWKNIIVQYPGQTRLYMPSGYQTAIRPPGDPRSNTYGASSMPNTYRAYNIYMSGLLGRTPDLSPRCALSVYPSQIVAGQSARLYWIATDATSMTLSNGRGNSHALVPASGGSEAIPPRVDTTYTATAVKAGKSTTCSVTIDVLAGPPPGPFSYVSPVNGATVQSSSVTLKWGQAVGATSYEVYAGTSRSPTDKKPVATGVTETSYVFNGLQPGGTSYHWLIKAINSNGTTTISNSTNPWSFTTGNF